MKIAILTQPLKTNFGGILQDYALQTVLRNLGHEPVTIDYDCRYTKSRWLLGRIKSIIYRTPHHIQFPHYNRAGQENLNRFIHKHITMTKPVDVPSREIFYSINPDAFVVGSDQVWSTACNVPIDYLGNMYLDFAQDFKGKRVAYAASFGCGEWTYTDEWTVKCKELVKKFDAVSVREDSGVMLCDKYLGVKATHVLDPTLLLTADDYDKLIPAPKKETNILFAYLLDKSKEKIDFLNKIAESNNLQLVLKGANDDLKWEDSIEGWLSDIRDAAMVVTDSFHGSVFSILFHRSFYSFANNKRGVDRFTSLFNMLDLQNRLLTNNISVESISNTIDWVKVDKKLQHLRNDSIDFINNSLIE